MSDTPAADLYDRLNKMVDAGEAEPNDDLVVAVLGVAGEALDDVIAARADRIRRLAADCRHIAITAVIRRRSPGD